MTRVLGYVAGCAALFVVALGVGRLVGPVAAEPASDHASEHTGMSGTGAPSEHDVGGLAASSQGWTLALASTDGAPGRQRVAFTIRGEGGDPLTTYDEQHERDLHLVVVRRDLTGFEHVHPTLDRDSGEWSVDDVDLTPGAWRVLADFVPAGGAKTVLGADLLVPGDFAPQPLGPDARTASVDGYDVTLAGAVRSHDDTVLTATVSRAGVPVTDLEPYLGAHGHLAALRDGDLGYLHVHPEEGGGAGPEVAFRTAFPSAGRYRLFLDFQHGGAVHTASFTVSVDDH